MKNKIRIIFSAVFIGNIIFSSLSIAQKPELTKNMPVIESRSEGQQDYYVILFTGNGGWKPLVKAITQYLNSQDVSVVAINSYKYFRSEKKPEQIACDLEGIIDRYNIKWNMGKVVLLGYSMGAEVIPFAVNRLDKKYTDMLQDIVMIAPWQKATFKDKWIDHLIDIDKGFDINVEIDKMEYKNAFIICDDNKISLCHEQLDNKIDPEVLEGGHHFGGDYLRLSKLIGKRLKLE
jgi:type IV secretory pathway VirJ component